MSYYWTKFLPSKEQISKEEENLYRIRDHDDPNISKGKLVNLNFLYQHRDSKIKPDKTKALTITPKDPIWDSMTETERVENGLPSKFLYRIYSFQHFTIFGFALGLALYNYQTLYYPFGVVLRAQRYENWGRYIRLRAPLTLCAFWGFYSLYMYSNNYTIDFSSSDEIDLDKEFYKISK